MCFQEYLTLVWSFSSFSFDSIVELSQVFPTQQMCKQLLNFSSLLRSQWKWWSMNNEINVKFQATFQISTTHCKKTWSYKQGCNSAENMSKKEDNFPTGKCVLHNCLFAQFWSDLIYFLCSLRDQKRGFPWIKSQIPSTAVNNEKEQKTVKWKSVIQTNRKHII